MGGGDLAIPLLGFLSGKLQRNDDISDKTLTEQLHLCGRDIANGRAKIEVATRTFGKSTKTLHTHPVNQTLQDR